MKKTTLALLIVLLFSFTTTNLKKQEISAILTVRTDQPTYTIYWQFSEPFYGWIEIQRAGSENGNFKTLFPLHTQPEEIYGGIPVNNKGIYRIKILGELTNPNPVYSNVVKL